MIFIEFGKLEICYKIL